MENIVQVIQALPKLLSFKAAQEAEISNAEMELKVQFAEEYKAYLSEFGAVVADGIELTGVANAVHRNVVAVTKRERELNAYMRMEKYRQMYVVKDTGMDGIVIWQDPSGKIYSTLSQQEPMLIAGSLAEYIGKRD